MTLRAVYVFVCIAFLIRESFELCVIWRCVSVGIDGFLGVSMCVSLCDVIYGQTVGTFLGFGEFGRISHSLWG